ncbi:MAG: hypothetical protein ABI317_07190 [Gaiellales bacterium]
MLGIFVNGPWGATARDVGDPPPASLSADSTPQFGHAEEYVSLYGLAGLLEQDTGPTFALYEHLADPPAGPSPFEELVEAARGRFGWHVEIRLEPYMSVGVAGPDGPADGWLETLDLDEAAYAIAETSMWPSPRRPDVA